MKAVTRPVFTTGGIEKVSEKLNDLAKVFNVG